MKIAAITCYHDPDYVRARSLRAGLQQIAGVQTIVVKNSHTGLLRYPEVLWALWKVKREQRPDAYLLTFRGQEILPFVLLIAGKKPVWFDEFIVPGAYARGEHHKRTPAILVKHALARVSEPLYNWWLHRCKAILADTQAHAEVSAKAARLNLSKYTAIPVGVDEKLFKPGAAKPDSETFQVFYYSTGMQPLHGIDTVLAAAELLKDNEHIQFLLVGGKRPMRLKVEEAVKNGARAHYVSWIPFADLPGVMRSSGICLGGPFGNTPQANHVVTGKTYQMIASGAPVIVGASVATSEYFVNEKNALVVPQADPEALAKAIVWASEHPHDLAEIAENGRKLFEKEFSTQAIARRLQPLIDAI